MTQTLKPIRVQHSGMFRGQMRPEGENFNPRNDAATVRPVGGSFILRGCFQTVEMVQ